MSKTEFNPLEAARRVFAMEIAELRALEERLVCGGARGGEGGAGDGGGLGYAFGRAVELMRGAVENRGKIVVCGVGKSGHIGEKIAATLTSTGSPAVVLNSLNALHGDLGVVADGDVVLALSYSGESDELVNILPALERFDVKIISVTGNPQSFVASNSHVHLEVRVTQEACPLNLAPTSSTTAMLVLGDALAMVLLEARGFSREDFARFHPAGRLGRSLLLKVRQIMRGPEQMALVHPEQSVGEVLRAMNRCRSGAAVAVDKEGKLAGIFTHGDFARHYEQDAEVGARRVGDLLTRNPVTVGAEKLAVEVLHLLKEHRIDDLVVVDGEGAPIGMVDSQDLARHRLI